MMSHSSLTRTPTFPSSSSSSSSRPSRLSLDLEAEIDRIDQEINRLQPQTPISARSHLSIVSPPSTSTPLHSLSPNQSPQSVQSAQSPTSYSSSSTASNESLSPTSPLISLSPLHSLPLPSAALPTVIPSPTIESTSTSYLPLVNQLLSTISHYASTLSSSFSSLPNEVTQCQIQLNQALSHYTNKRQKEIKHKQKESTQIIQQLKELRNSIENDFSSSTTTTTTQIHSLLTPLLSTITTLTSNPLGVFDPFHILELKELTSRNTTLQSLLTNMGSNHELELSKVKQELNNHCNMEKNRLLLQMEEEKIKFKKEIELVEMKYKNLEDQLLVAVDLHEGFKRIEIQWNSDKKEYENKLNIEIQNNKQSNAQIVILSNTLNNQTIQINSLMEDKKELNKKIQSLVDNETKLQEINTTTTHNHSNTINEIINKTTLELKNIEREFKLLTHHDSPSNLIPSDNPLSLLKSLMRTDYSAVTAVNGAESGIGRISQYYEMLSQMSSGIMVGCSSISNQMNQINLHYKNIINNGKNKQKEKINSIHLNHNKKIEELTVNLQKQLEEIQENHNKKLIDIEKNNKLHLELTLSILMEENNKKNKMIENKIMENNKNNISILENELKLKNTEVINWENKYKELINKNTELTEIQIKNQKKKLEEIQEEYRAKIQEITSNASNKGNQSNTTIIELSNHIEKLQEYKKNIESEINNKNNEITEYQNKLTILNTKLHTHHAELLKLEADCNDKYSDQLQLLKEQYEREEYKRENQMEIKMNNIKGNVLDEYESKIKSLKSKLQAEIQEITEEFENEKKNLVNELNHKEEKIQGLNHELMNLTNNLQSQYNNNLNIITNTHKNTLNSTITQCQKRIKSLLVHYRQREELLCRECKKRCRVVGVNFLLLCEEYCKKKGGEVEANSTRRENEESINSSRTSKNYEVEEEEDESINTSKIDISQMNEEEKIIDNSNSDNAITTADLDSPTELVSPARHIMQNTSDTGRKLLSFSDNHIQSRIQLGNSRSNSSIVREDNKNKSVSSHNSLNSHDNSKLKKSVKGNSSKSKNQSVYAAMLDEYLASYNSSGRNE